MHHLTRIVRGAVVLLALLALAAAGPTTVRTITPADVGPQIDTARFLKQRHPTFPLPGSFAGKISELYALYDVWAYTDDESIARARINPTFPRFYQPTWEEYFDSIARQARCSWSWNPANRQWKFAKPPMPLPFTLEPAKGWRSEDRGGYVWYAPADAPMGMDVYILGRYSSDAPDAALHARVRDALAIQFAIAFKRDVKPAEMTRVQVAGAEALYFQAPAPRPNSTWRQWALVKDGRAFVIVSAMDNAQEAALLPQVKAMVASFDLSRPATQPGDAVRRER